VYLGKAKKVAFKGKLTSPTPTAGVNPAALFTSVAFGRGGYTDLLADSFSVF